MGNVFSSDANINKTMTVEFLQGAFGSMIGGNNKARIIELSNGSHVMMRIMDSNFKNRPGTNEWQGINYDGNISDRSLFFRSWNGTSNIGTIKFSDQNAWRYYKNVLGL